jgi:hypothetical protein
MSDGRSSVMSPTEMYRRVTPSARAGGALSMRVCASAVSATTARMSSRVSVRMTMLVSAALRRPSVMTMGVSRVMGQNTPRLTARVTCANDAGRRSTAIDREGTPGWMSHTASESTRALPATAGFSSRV